MTWGFLAESNKITGAEKHISLSHNVRFTEKSCSFRHNDFSLTFSQL
jgi:hypothetical protein